MQPEPAFLERYGTAVFDVPALILGAGVVAVVLGYFAIDLWRLRRTLSRKGRANAVALFLAVAGGLLMVLRACSLNGQEPAPTPTPTPTLSQAAQELLLRLANTITTPIVNALGAHPIAMLVGILFVIVALGVTNGVRRAWPVKRLPTDQPRWAAFLLGFFDPFVGNFWNLFGWAGRKTHVPVYVPPEDVRGDQNDGRGGP